MAYDELVRQLRACIDENIPCGQADCGYKPFGNEDCVDNLMRRAADAIEELTAVAESYKRSMEAWADEAARARPRWIPVTEWLPKEDCQVLAYYGFNRGDGNLGMMFMQVMDYYTDDPRPHFQHEGLNGLTVTHWMPRPEPPRSWKNETTKRSL